MRIPQFRRIGAFAIVAAGLALSGCVTDGYGRSYGGVSLGTGWYDGYYDDYYPGYYGYGYNNPGYGWYGYPRGYYRHDGKGRGHWQGKPPRAGNHWQGRPPRGDGNRWRGNSPGNDRATYMDRFKARGSDGGGRPDWGRSKGARGK